MTCHSSHKEGKHHMLVRSAQPASASLSSEPGTHRDPLMDGQEERRAWIRGGVGVWDGM